MNLLSNKTNARANGGIMEWYKIVKKRLFIIKSAMNCVIIFVNAVFLKPMFVMIKNGDRMHVSSYFSQSANAIHGAALAQWPAGHISYWFHTFVAWLIHNLISLAQLINNTVCPYSAALWPTTAFISFNPFSNCYQDIFTSMILINKLMELYLPFCRFSLIALGCISLYICTTSVDWAKLISDLWSNRITFIICTLLHYIWLQ